MKQSTDPGRWPRLATLGIAFTVGWIAALGATTSLSAQAESSGEPPPNVILIVADDLGYGDLGVFGNELIETPNLDRLADEGLLLSSFYSSANVCTAARGGLLTGRYPIRLGLVTDVARPTNGLGIADDEVTLAEALRSAGYRTALIGKWHLGSHEPHFPTRHGFERFYGLLHSNDMTPLVLYDQDHIVEETVNQARLTERYTQRAIEFIGRHRNETFFLYLPHTFPHVPLHVSNRFAGSSEAGLYGDVVEAIDWSTGQILRALELFELDRRTLVLFTSDNGPWWEGSSGAFRDRKGSAWEGGLRVPFLARWPGSIPAGSRSAAPVMNIDVFPTVLELAGVDLPADRPIDGVSLVPLLRGEEIERAPLYLFDRDRIAAVRSGRWKLVVESKYVTAIARIGHPDYSYYPGLLFDLERDPGEAYSFTREFPEVAARLRAVLEQGQLDLGATVPSSVWSLPSR